jgi:tetratricopeptide (TPR) repeat protein
MPTRRPTMMVQVSLEESNSDTAGDSISPRIIPPPIERFHADLERVLSRSRGSRQEGRMERRKRPPVLETDVDGAERAYAMLQHMIELGVANETSFQMVMEAFAYRGRLRWKTVDSNGEASIICAADQVERLLQQLEYQDTDVSVDTYNLLLQAYANCATPRGERNYAMRADALLERMDSFDTQSLTHVLHAWSWQQANLQSGECAQRATEILERLEETIDPASRTESIQLMQCYDWVLEAWSKSSSEGSSQKADSIFQRMKQLKLIMPFEDDDADESCALPNAESYSNIILAWSKSPGESAVLRANELLLEMIDEFRAGNLANSEPELIAFNGVITSWARLGRPDKAESALWLMVGMQNECERLVPDVLTYNSVLHSHVMSRDKSKALDRIIDIVTYMEDHWKEQPQIRPDSFTYNTLMKAWVQSGREDAAEQIEAILTKMENYADRNHSGFDLSNRHFNVLINAYAKSKDRFAAGKAHGLLKRMQHSKHVKPDIISFTSVIECYSKSSDPDASIIAEQLLKEAFENYKTNKDPKLMPNLRTFTMVILSLARCPRGGNAAKARTLLEQLVKFYEESGDESLRPNEYPYNYVLNCAANTLGTTEEKIQAFQVATKTYQDMRKSFLVKPDSFTYAFWIKACNNLLPKTELYDKCVTLGFEQCKQDGLVSQEVLHRLQQGASLDLCQKVLAGSSSKEYRTMHVEALPPAWTRNARRATGKRRR